MAENVSFLRILRRIKEKFSILRSLRRIKEAWEPCLLLSKLFILTEKIASIENIKIDYHAKKILDFRPNNEKKRKIMNI